MSIRSRQIIRQSEKAVTEELQAGRFPELTAIQNKVTAYFGKKTAGLPRFEPVLFEKGQVSNHAHYNQMMYAIKEDMDVAFEEIDYHHKRLLAQEELNEKEKQRILLFLKEVEKKSIRINRMLRYRQAHAVFTENFFDFSFIEFDPQEDRNIAGTTAFIDLRNHLATLHQSQVGREKVFLGESDVEVKYYSKYNSFRNLGKAEYAIQDTVNTSWRLILVTNEPSEAKVGYTVALPKTEEISMVKIAIQSKSPVNIELLLSEDGESWVSQQAYDVTNDAQWVFAPKNVQYLQFLMTKNNYDVIEGMDYEYWFGVQNIRAYRESFVEKAYLTTKPFEVEGAWIDTIVLRVEEERHPTTNIRYFVGEDRDNTPIEWKEISPNQPFEMNMLSMHEQNFRPTQEGYGEPVVTSLSETRRRTVYVIGELEYDAVAERSQLIQGEQSWMVKYYPAGIDPTYIVDENGEKVPTGYRPSLVDWVGDVLSTTNFLDVDTAITQDDIHLLAGNYTLFEINMETDEVMAWSNKSIYVTGDVDFQIYVNQSLIKPTNVTMIGDKKVYQYNFYFEPGKQLLSIPVYSTPGGAISLRPFSFLEPQVKRIYGDNQEIRYVALDELIRYSSPREIHKFSLDNGKVVVPYDPKSLDYKRFLLGEGKGVHYYLKYRYVEERRENINLRLMAILERDPSMRQLSPLLKEYSLIVQ